MASYAAIADGNWSTAATWGTVSNTPTIHASTNITVSSTHYTAAFTAPNTTDDCVGMMFYIGTPGSLTYSYAITLQENTVDTAATVTLTMSDLVDTTAFRGWVFAKFPTSYTFTSTTAGYYRFKIVRSGTGTVNAQWAADSAGTAVSYVAVDDRTGTPTTGDDIWIIGANGTGTVTVTMDGTQLVGSASVASNSTRVVNTAVMVGAGGLLTWDTAASATLTMKGWMLISSPKSTNIAEVRIGDSTTAYPAAYTGSLLLDQNGANSTSRIVICYSETNLQYGKLTAYGVPKSSTTNWKTTYVSGAGTVADPMIVNDAVDWTTGDEVVITPTSDNAANDKEAEYMIVTKVDASTYSLVSTNQMVNEGFEGANFARWTQTAGNGAIAIETSSVHAGAKAVKITAGSLFNTNIYSEDVYVIPGTTYDLSFWTRGDGTYDGRYGVYNVTASSWITSATSTGVTGTSYTEVTTTFTAPAGCYKVRLYLWCPSTNGGIAYFDDCSITYDGLAATHNTNARVINLTRNVIIKSTTNSEGGGITSTVTTGIDMKWVRMENTYSAILDFAYLNSVMTTDYCVIYRPITSATTYSYAISNGSAANNTTTGLVICRNINGTTSYTTHGIGLYTTAGVGAKTFVDCFMINIEGRGFYSVIAAANITLTRMCLFGTTSAAYTVNGYNWTLTDCEVQCMRGGNFTETLVIGGTIGNCNIYRFHQGDKGQVTSAFSTAWYTGGGVGTPYIDIYCEECAWQTPPILDATVATWATGSEISFQDDDEVTNVDYVKSPTGQRYKTGTGLADTTAHTAGGYAMRVYPLSSTIPHTWSFNCPTGNIQNQTMTVAVWCKINSANYYSGTHQLPRLSVYYDNATTTYAEATETTDWQLLSVTFAPTTTFGQIVVTLSAMTDQTTTSAYVYFDDFAILYPAGYTLDLGAMDYWAGGNPVVPAIATNLSALSVWTAASTTDYGSNTMGNKLKVLQNPTALLGPIIV